VPQLPQQEDPTNVSAFPHVLATVVDPFERNESGEDLLVLRGSISTGPTSHFRPVPTLQRLPFATDPQSLVVCSYWQMTLVPRGSHGRTDSKITRSPAHRVDRSLSRLGSIAKVTKLNRPDHRMPGLPSLWTEWSRGGRAPALPSLQAYSVPMTWKSWLTKTWCGQLTPM
jgi:hypothetical protein